MNRNQERASADGYCIQVLIINGEVQNIGKGGFRFISDIKFELEDRLQVLLRFPDDHSQEVLGRICYSEAIDDETFAYGFSVIDGFYSLYVSNG